MAVLGQDLTFAIVLFPVQIHGCELDSEAERDGVDFNDVSVVLAGVCGELRRCGS